MTDLVLPKARHIDKQMVLFEKDKILKSTGSCRTWVGDFFEEATVQVSGAKRLKTDSNCEICPDHQFDEITFFECKGSGKNKQVILYDTRLEKDLRLSKSGRNLCYWIWCHNLRLKGIDTLSELRTRLAEETSEVLICSMGAIWRMVVDKPTRVVNSGWHDGAQGWTISTKQLKDQCFKAMKGGHLNEVSVYGTVLTEVRVFVSEPYFESFIKVGRV